jgi:hypothetical protein
LNSIIKSRSTISYYDASCSLFRYHGVWMDIEDWLGFTVSKNYFVHDCLRYSHFLPSQHLAPNTGFVLFSRQTNRSRSKKFKPSFDLAISRRNDYQPSHCCSTTSAFRSPDEKSRTNSGTIDPIGYDFISTKFKRRASEKDVGSFDKPALS